MFIELHIKGKLAAIDPGDIMAVLPDTKGFGALICESLQSFIAVDESVEDVLEMIAELVELELVPDNDDRGDA